MLNAEAYGVWTPFERKTCTINFSMNDMMFQMLTWLFCYFLHVRMSVLYIFCTVKFSRLMFQVSTWLFSSLSICLSCKFSVPVNFSRLKRYEKNFYTHGFQKIHIHGLGLRKYRQLESRIIPGRYYVKRNMKWIRPSSWKLIYYVKWTGFFFSSSFDDKIYFLDLSTYLFFSSAFSSKAQMFNFFVTQCNPIHHLHHSSTNQPPTKQQYTTLKTHFSSFLSVFDSSQAFT